MERKSAGLLNNKITEQFNRFCAKSELRLLGSNALRGMHFPADVDTQCIVTDLNADQLAKYIQNAVSKLGDAFITEFKITIDKKKYRWTQKDLTKGKKNGMTLSDALSQANGIVKCDMIIPVNDGFVDATINYLITLNGETNIKPTSVKEKVDELKGEMKEYKKDNMFKALKRRFSILNLQGKKTEHIYPFFNGEVGILSQSRNELELLSQLHKQKVSFVKLEGFIQLIKQKLGNIPTIDRDTLFNMNKWTTKNIQKNIKTLMEILLRQMNEDTNIFIKVHKITL
tara:strand:+ start:107 stop:961 length:855 start_codon:yes stop_codon:yes gene_type:complete